MTGRPRQPYDGVAVCCPVTVPYVRYSIESAHWWIGRALRELCQSFGIGHRDLDGLSVSSFTLAPDTGVGLTQHLGLTPRWLDNIPMGGASGIVALRRAARAVQAGDATMVACVAGDTNHVDSFRRLLGSFSRFAQDASYPYGFGGPNAAFALLTDHYMRTYDVQRAAFGALCVAQRLNALANPYAIMKKSLSLDDYLSARPISDPLHLFDCVMPVAGAEAFLVTTEAIARAKGLPHVRIRATIERHNAFPDDPVQMRGGWAMDVDELWSMAGMGPEDVDVVQTYDDYPVIVALQVEDLGFCAKGEGADFLAERDTSASGAFPHNTNGGQLSAGQAGAAGGYLGMVEALRQLTGQVLGARVSGAKRALVSGFGMINFDRGLCSGAAVLEASPTCIG